MTQILKFALLTLLLGGAAWFTPTARADAWDKLTILTFNDPVEIPGQVLPAGTYAFRLLDTPDRRVVQIFTEDQMQLLATVQAIPDYRMKPTGDTVVTFEERAPGKPQALHAWFYPGDNSGFEFVYPKLEPQIVAKAEQPAPAPEPPAPQTAPEQPVVEQPAPEPPKEEAVLVREQEVILAETAPVPADNAAPVELPKTAGNFALIPLLGMALFSAGFTAYRFAMKQS